MRHLSVLSVLVLGPWLAAVESLGSWQFGTGTVDGAAATVGTEIPADALVASGDGPIRVSLAKAPKSQLLLAPGSSLRLVEDGDSIIVRLESGVLQANIADKGPYQDLHVVGGAIDARVTGTLFVVERVKKDTDYVALVEGKLQVNLRKDVAQALNQQEGGIELIGRQGVGGSSSGLASVDALASRPQLPTTMSARETPVRDDALAGEGGWEQDIGMDVTNEVMNQVADQVGGSITDEVRQGIADEVANQVIQDVSNQVRDAIVQDVVGGGFAPLGEPPAPPPR